MKEAIKKVNVENGWRLSDEQIEILNMLDYGYTQAEIAAEMGYCQKTISNKIAQIKKKLKKMKKNY